MGLARLDLHERPLLTVAIVDDVGVRLCLIQRPSLALPAFLARRVSIAVADDVWLNFDPPLAAAALFLLRLPAFLACRPPCAEADDVGLNFVPPLALSAAAARLARGSFCLLSLPASHTVGLP